MNLLENAKHVAFARGVLCTSELRYSLLATMANCPGMSSIITSLAYHPPTGAMADEKDTNDIVALYEQSLSNSVYEVSL